MPELKIKFDELEKRILKLISLHKQQKSENQKLVQLNKALELELHAAKQRSERLEAVMANRKEAEKGITQKSVSGIRKKVNEMISEIDRSVTLINSQHKK
jgi:ferritin-like metal-binding protein YciE